MKVLLSHAYYLEEDEKEQKIMRPYPPLGILCISSYLDQHGIENEVFDTTFSSKKIFKEYLLQHRPTVLALYVNLMTKINVLEAIHYVSTHLPDTVVILGGPEVRYSAEKFLHQGAHIIVIGEGETTMLEIVQTLQKQDGVYNADSLQAIQGVAFLKSKVFFQTSEREKIKDLDLLTIPNREKINLQLYLDAWKKHHGKNAISISTMRGCPYTCKWCSRAVYGLSYRRRSPAKVVEEVEHLLKTYNPNSLWFVDDVFTISHKWLSGFRDELSKRNVHIPYECITRADRMNADVIQMLKETGCFRVWIGAESGSQKVIDLMDRRVDVNQVRDMIRLTQHYGIEAGTFIMLGYPGETKEDIEETIAHLKESNPDHFTITVAYPIKGTELYQEIEAVQTTHLDWTTSTDRDIDFKRTYSRRYYDFAVRRVQNEVNFFKEKNKQWNMRVVKLKIKSLTAKFAMQWYEFET